jgi:hypothetical protein
MGKSVFSFFGSPKSSPMVGGFQRKTGLIRVDIMMQYDASATILCDMLRDSWKAKVSGDNTKCLDLLGSIWNCIKPILKNFPTIALQRKAAQLSAKGFDAKNGEGKNRRERERGKGFHLATHVIKDDITAYNCLMEVYNHIYDRMEYFIKKELSLKWVGYDDKNATDSWVVAYFINNAAMFFNKKVREKGNGRERGVPMGENGQPIEPREMIRKTPNPKTIGQNRMIRVDIMTKVESSLRKQKDGFALAWAYGITKTAYKMGSATEKTQKEPWDILGVSPPTFYSWMDRFQKQMIKVTSADDSPRLFVQACLTLAEKLIAQA